jgi:type I restriction enzyme S subunit
MALAPYPEYKDSGVPWLGVIPAHWEAIKLKRVSYVQAGVTLGKHYDHVELIERPYLRVANVQNGFLNLKHIKTVAVPEKEALSAKLISGDVVVTEGGDIDKLGRGAIWNGEIENCLHQNHIFAIRPVRERLLSDFLARALEGHHGRSYFYLTAKRTTNLAATNQTTLGLLPLFLPSIDEQTQITRFLDWKTAQIDKFIRNKRRLIELLKEQKQNIINQAVTRGLDPNAKLKPSGVEWIGDIPAHWEARKLKFVSKMIVGGATPTSGQGELWDGDVVWITPQDVSKSERLHSSARKLTTTGIASCSTVLVPAGSVIVTSRAPVGNVSIAEVELCTNQGCKAVVPDERYFSSEYCFVLLKIMQPVFQRAANGTTFFEISTWVFENIKVPLPSIHEQKQILVHIQETSTSIDQAITRSEREIELIREYRTRLIADVVTGQVDVRGIEVPDIAGGQRLALAENAAETRDMMADEAETEAGT